MLSLVPTYSGLSSSTCQAHPVLLTAHEVHHYKMQATLIILNDSTWHKNMASCLRAGVTKNILILMFKINDSSNDHWEFICQVYSVIKKRLCKKRCF